MKKALSNYFKTKSIASIIIGVVVIVVVVFLILSRTGSSFEVALSGVGSITEKINVTGKVAALKKAELGFEKGGVVSSINYEVGDSVKIGDILVALDSADVTAQLRGAQASLLAEKANLSQLMAGLRPEELSVEGSKLRSAQVNYDDARIGIINALHDSYAKTENAITNYADTLFRNPQTVAPRIIVRTDSYTQESSINDSRILVGENLRSWKSDLDGMSLLSDPNTYLEKVHDYLTNAKDMLSRLSTIISNLSTGNSGISQITIDSYNQTVNTALSTFNTAVSSLATAEANYKTSLSSLSLTKDQFDLRKAGSSEQAIQAQQAKVDQASANVLSYQAELAKKRLISPINGIVTKVQPELGEFVSMGQVAIVIMSDVFKVEVNIPESDIAKVAIGNPASITLDAYDSSTIFNAHVSAIDPAETIVEGVPTYKVTLQFDQADQRVRSGMTANIDVITNKKDGVVIVPYRAVLDKSGEKYVRVVNSSDPDDFSEVKVQIGVKGNDGNIEIVGGLNPGVQIITSIK